MKRIACYNLFSAIYVAAMLVKQVYFKETSDVSDLFVATICGAFLLQLCVFVFLNAKGCERAAVIMSYIFMFPLLLVNMIINIEGGTDIPLYSFAISAAMPF